jgi:S-adenosylmethionine decarboxylase
MLRAAREVGATVVTHSFHRFQPYGISGVVVIAESHLSIHTWPEHSYAAVDIFSCSASFRPDAAARIIAEGLECTSPFLLIVERGTSPEAAFRPMLKEALPGQRR